MCIRDRERTDPACGDAGTKAGCFQYTGICAETKDWICFSDSGGGPDRRKDVYKRQVYEYTDISLEGLPENLQKEIQNGKYIETSESLYGFLENYSS